MYEYGKLILKNKLDKSSKEEGIQMILKSIEKGYPQAMFKYGFLLLKGVEITINQVEGIRYVEMAADKGHKNALYYCTILLNNNKEKEYQYLKKASYKGHVDAMLYYGNELFNECGDDKTKQKEAVAFLKKAAESGNLTAIYLYGLINEMGKGIPIDLVKSLKLIKIVANKGNADAMNYYGTKLFFWTGCWSW